MKLKKIQLVQLRNEEHFQFMTEVKDLVEKSGAATLNIDQLFAVFFALYNKEDELIEIIRKSDITELITETDNNRDGLLRGLALIVEAYTQSIHPKKRKQLDVCRMCLIITAICAEKPITKKQRELSI